MRSRNSRSCGTVLKCALAFGFCFSSISISAADIVTVLTSVRQFAGSAQCGYGEDYRVELFKIPQFREIKPNWCWFSQAAFINLIDEPGNTFIHGVCVYSPRPSGGEGLGVRGVP